MLINRDEILKLLRSNGQNPQIAKSDTFKPNTGTVIETDTKGIYYILEYNGDGGVGWTITYNKLKQISSYKNYAILFINSKDGEMFIILDNNKHFYNSLQQKTSPYKISRKDVENYSISLENLDEYFSK